MENLISSPIFLFFIGFLGMICHFLKKYQTKQISIQDKSIGKTLIHYFFRTDLINTLLGIIAYVITFFILYTMGSQTIFSMFSCGYMSDSLFNRSSKKGIGI